MRRILPFKQIQYSGVSKIGENAFDLEAYTFHVDTFISC